MSAAESEKLDRLSTLLDSKYRIPGTPIRFGGIFWLVSFQALAMSPLSARQHIWYTRPTGWARTSAQSRVWLSILIWIFSSGLFQ